MERARRIEDGLEQAPLPDLNTSLDLARRAGAGEAEALEQLLSRYQERLRRIVRIRLGGRLRRRVESIDIVQETMQVVARKIDQADFTSHAAILNWMARIAERKIQDARRYHEAEKRDVRRERAFEPASSSEESPLCLPALDSSPTQRVSRVELAEIMDEELARLPDDYREVILLRDYHGGDWDYVTAQLARPNPRACQELHRRAWIRLRLAVGRRMRTEE